MSVNPYRPHIIVLPEDDANRDLVRGFVQQVANARQLYTTKVAGGWRNVLEAFREYHIGEMIRCPNRLMVLLIDFDRDEGRLAEAKEAIPDHLIGRVFVLGAWHEPEDLKGTDLGLSLEEVGKALADDCRHNTDQRWRHPLLRHNAAELTRLRDRARAILFN